MKRKNKINIFELIKKAKPISSRVNLYTMYKANITKKGEKNANNTRGYTYK
mgnify:CR=1 FL=1|tara:strand:+ start:1135 stop:1287 length:153 start_codon:yes stop_codon:yes gene_type:complete